MHGRSTKQRRAAMRRKAWLRNWTRKSTPEEMAIIAEATAAFAFGPMSYYLVYAEPPKETK